MRRSSVLLGAVLALLCASAASSWAQGDGGKEQRAALTEQLDQRARTAYRLGEFDNAIAQWKEAYRLSSHPVFLYNIAQSHRRKESFKTAIFFYRQFLQEDPKAANRAAVEARIAELEKLLAGQNEVKDAQPQEPLSTGENKASPEPSEVEETAEESSEPPPPTAVPPQTTTTDARVATRELPAANPLPATTASPEPEKGSSRNTLKFAGMGAGGAGILLVGVSVAYAFKASSAESDVEAARVDGRPWSDELQDRQDAGQQAALIGKLTAGLGAAALISGGVMYFLGSKSEGEHAGHVGLQISPSVSSSEVSLALRSTF